MNRSIIAFLIFLACRTDAQVLFDETGSSRPPHHIDVLHYALDLSFDEANRSVSGACEISFRWRGEPADSIHLDGVGMTVHSVTNQFGEPVGHSTNGQFVSVQITPEMRRTDSNRVSISYSCKPVQGLYFIQPDSADLTRRWQIWTQGEESDNRFWFPCYDAPDDKATSELRGTVPAAYELLSNGELLSVTSHPEEGTRTFHWKQRLPHSSYLIMVAAGEYAILHDRSGPVPIMHYVYPEDSSFARIIYARTGEVIRFLEDVTGFPYPWEKYAHVILDEFMWGGMENTSAVTLNDVYLYDRRTSLDFTADAVIAHEVAHQWWGDVVTCADWTHLWLNEGFANYYEALYKREAFGEDEDLIEAAGWARSIKAVESRSGRKPIVSPESYTVNLYNKGAWVLRMLAEILGEDELHEALGVFLREHAFAPVTTEDLIGSLEESTGEELRWFFDQWVYGTGIPELTITSDWSPSRSLLRLTVRQEQETDSLTGFFRFPVSVQITDESGKNVHRIWVSEEEETFSFPVGGRPLMVLFDKGRRVLNSNSFEKTSAEWLYQLAYAWNAVDRIDALAGLGSLVDEQGVFDAVKRAALHDESSAVRQKAVETLAVSEDPRASSVLMEAYGDGESNVRNAAIRSLERFRGDEAASFVETAALGDSSYYVLASCIRTLSSLDPARAFLLAERFLSLDSHRDIVRSAALEAFRKAGDRRAVPLVIPVTGPEYERGTRRRAVDVLGEVGRSDPEARAALMSIAGSPLPDLRKSAVRALGSWEDSSVRIFLRERSAQETDSDVGDVLREILGEAGGN